CQHYYDIRLTF
nr:immunoglobulin light chain junction region [Macaca mulatta]MOV62277.1 immunoglobulin light chain junction region [Macaca mulatta]MOV62287.1 immunoglobulin light chain junction region [Macaca mulatta]MOV62769.1 immunoglobulin light chain junction region [Macaca mulatta]MOV63911.1 immunoglobulin light chain junction region [Macaca mulatta]